MLRIFISILILFWASIAQAVTFDASSSGSCNNGTCVSGTTLTVSHTTGGSANAMLVGVSIGCVSPDTAPAISSVTHAGSQSLSAIATANPSAQRRIEIWALAAGTSPTTGTNNVVVVLATALSTACTSAGVSSMAAQVITAIGVHSSTLTTSTGSNSGSGTSATLTLGSAGGSDLTTFFMCSGDGITSVTTGTERGPQIDITTNSCGSSTSATNGSSLSFAATIPSDSWITIGAALKDAGGAGPSCSGALTTRGIGGC